MADPLIRTLAELPFHVSGRYPKSVLVRRCVGASTVDRSSRELFDEVRDLSLGLQGLGVVAGDRVAILSDSRPEWTITDLAILTAGAVTVPVYASLPAGQVGYILAHSGVRVVVAADDSQVAKVRQEWPRLPALETIVIMDAGDGGRQQGVVDQFVDLAVRNIFFHVTHFLRPDYRVRIMLPTRYSRRS